MPVDKSRISVDKQAKPSDVDLTCVRTIGTTRVICCSRCGSTHDLRRVRANGKKTRPAKYYCVGCVKKIV